MTNTTVDVMRELKQSNNNFFTFYNMEELDPNFIKIKVLIDTKNILDYPELKTPENLASIKVVDKSRYYLRFKV